MRSKSLILSNCEIFILAGGLSSRMGRDKSRARFGEKTMLEHVRAVGQQTGLRVRVIRRDAVPRCGPLGGIYTALKRSHSGIVLILACDMPFITRALLVKMLKRFHQPSTTALFSSENNHVGFPFLLRREAALPVVIEQIQTGDYSLQSFAKKLRAKTFRASKRHLANINTPAELAKAAWRVRQKK